MAFKLHHAALAIAALASMGAQAATYNAGTLTPTPEVAYSPVVGAFADTINFTIADPNNILGGNVANLPITVGLTNITNIAGLSVSLFDSLGTSFSALISSSGSNAYTFTGALQSGSYSLNVSGTGTGLGGAGGYTYALAAAPVPEPETYALLLAGLGLLAGVARRRA